jgi:hypothetical protein
MSSPLLGFTTSAAIYVQASRCRALGDEPDREIVSGGREFFFSVSCFPFIIKRVMAILGQIYPVVQVFILNREKSPPTGY